MKIFFKISRKTSQNAFQLIRQLLHLSSFTPLQFFCQALMTEKFLSRFALPRSCVKFTVFKYQMDFYTPIESIVFSLFLSERITVSSLATMKKMTHPPPAAHWWHQMDIRRRGSIISETWRRLTDSLSPANLLAARYQLPSLLTKQNLSRKLELAKEAHYVPGTHSIKTQRKHRTQQSRDGWVG